IDDKTRHHDDDRRVRHRARRQRRWGLDRLAARGGRGGEGEVQRPIRLGQLRASARGRGRRAAPVRAAAGAAGGVRGARRRPPPRWARLRSLRPLAGALVAGVVAMLVASATFGDTASSPEPIALAGGGSWVMLFHERTAWQNALGSASQPIDMQYTPHG